MNIAVTFLPRREPRPVPPVAFIGGGNMARAIVGGLIKGGSAPSNFEIVEPDADARAQLEHDFGIVARPTPSAALGRCEVVVWAVKPQAFAGAAKQVLGLADNALHLSVAAGISTGSIAGWLALERVVRAMPNTPALVGEGITGLYARPAVDAGDRELVEQVLGATGELLWVDTEDRLDAVTAVSGSGPAYVFYFIEALTEAAVELGLSPDQAHRLALRTFKGATSLALGATEDPATLRQRVTSKGGTTHAAIASMESAGLKEHFKTAVRAAHRRAGELGKEFGGNT